MEALLLPKACLPSSQLKLWGGQATCPASFDCVEGSVLDPGLIQNMPCPGKLCCLPREMGESAYESPDAQKNSIELAEGVMERPANLPGLFRVSTAGTPSSQDSRSHQPYVPTASP